MRSQTEAFCARTFAYCYYFPHENEPLLLLLDGHSPRGRKRKGIENLTLRQNGLVDAAIITVVRRIFIDVYFSLIVGKCACKTLLERSSAANILERRQQTQGVYFIHLFIYSFFFCHRLNVHCTTMALHGRSTTCSIVGAQKCQLRNCICCVSAFTCLPEAETSLMSPGACSVVQ